MESGHPTPYTILRDGMQARVAPPPLSPGRILRTKTDSGKVGGMSLSPGGTLLLQSLLASSCLLRAIRETHICALQSHIHTLALPSTPSWGWIQGLRVLRRLSLESRWRD